MRIVAALIDMYGPSDLDILCAWFRGVVPPLPTRYNSRGVLHSYYYYRVGAGPFVSSSDRPVCRRGGRNIVGDDLSDERRERPVWDYDRAFVGPDGHFVKGYYPAHDPESLPQELREPFVQYNIAAMLALGSGWPSRIWEDLVPMTTEVRSGSSYRFVGPHTPSCGNHSPEYHGALAASDFSQCMLKVAAGVYAGFYEAQPFAVMKLNGRKNVPKKDASGSRSVTA
jgi:hypothetical protein